MGIGLYQMTFLNILKGPYDFIIVILLIYWKTWIDFQIGSHLEFLKYTPFGSWHIVSVSLDMLAGIYLEFLFLN